MEPLLVAVADDARARLASVLAGREDLLQDLGREVETRPVICVHAVPFARRLGKSTIHAFRTACVALGARGVIDLLEFPDDEAGNAQVRAAIEACLSDPLIFPSISLPAA